MANLNVIPSTLICLALIASQLHAGPREDAYDALRQGMVYQDAREIILNGGWQGARLYAEMGCQTHDDTCARFPEVDSCTGIGDPLCRFVFTDGRSNRLVVVTFGEDPRSFLVDHWFIEGAER